MLDLRIAELSATAGTSSDGIVRGAVAQSLVAKAITSTQTSDTVYAIRKDSGVGFNFIDISTQAISGTTDAFEPWGPTSSFSSGDALYVACNEDVKELYFQITTPGAWTGTGLSVFDSSDGITAGRQLTVTTDETNGFRASAGIRKLAFTAPATPSQAFSPVPGDIASRKWIVIKPNGLTAATTPPKLSRVWIIHPDNEVTYRDFTTTTTAALTDTDFTATPDTVFYIVGSTVMYVFPFLTYGLDHTIHRKLADVVTFAHEYLATDDTWKPLQNFVDPSNDRKNGPAALGDPTQTFPIRWSIPVDWTEKTITYPLTVGGNVVTTGYFIRQRVTAVATTGPTATPLTRSRCRSFGVANSSGIYHKNAITYGAVTFDIGVPSAASAAVQFVNINTGQASTVTIPASTRSSGAITGQRLDCSLAMAAGQSLLVTHAGGGTLMDIEMRLQS